MVMRLTSVSPILPAVRQLTLRFSEGAGRAPGLLLRALPRIEQLEICLGNTLFAWQFDLDADIFDAIGALVHLRTLIVQLHPCLNISDTEMVALGALQNLQRLELSEMLIREEEGFGLPWKSTLQVTGSRMVQALINLAKLECLHIDIVGGSVHFSYHDAVLMHHILSNLRHCHIRDFIIHSDDVSQVEWFNEAVIINVP